MCTPLAKLAIGLSATMATAFYYLAAAPPASAVDVCGPGNFSTECTTVKPPSPPPPPPSPTSQRNSVQEPVVESPAVIAEPVEEVSPTEPEQTAPTLNFTDIYTTTTDTTVTRTAIPEPGTVVALLMTGGGIICFGRKRNKQVGQQR